MPAVAEGPLGPHVDSIIRPGSHHMVSCSHTWAGISFSTQNGTDPAWRYARLLGPSARGCSFGRNCCSQPAQALVWERPFWSKEGLRLQSAQRPISGFCANSRRGRHEGWDAGRQGLRPPSGETPLDPKNRICISTSAAIQDVFCRDTSLERTTSFL